MNSIIELFN